MGPDRSDYGPPTEREEEYVGEHVAVLGQDFTSGFWTTACSCGWESTESALHDEADAIDAWDHHCDVVFMESTGG